MPPIRWATRLVGAGALAGTFGVAGLTVWSARRVNKRRERVFTDEFHLTPETLRMPYRRVSFHTDDDVALSGWWIPQSVAGEPSKSVVMCCAPYNNHMSSSLGVARGLWESGRSVLLFDFRSFAVNPTAQTVGHLELRDARAAMAWLRSEAPKESRVALVGASMGGAVALSLAAEEGDGISACATDCAFASLSDVVRFLLSAKFSGLLPPWGLDGLVSAINLCNEAFWGYNLREVGPAARLNKVIVPLLLVHSEEDSVVPVEQAFKIASGVGTAREKVQVVIEPGLEHIGSYFNNEQAYVKRIVDFLDEQECEAARVQAAASARREESTCTREAERS